MPPAKRGLKFSASGSGIARTHLMDNFSTIPKSFDELLGGHVLYLYINNECNISHTAKEITQKLSVHPEIQDLSYPIKKLTASSIYKFKKLSNPKELHSYKTICNEPFKNMCVYRTYTKKSTPSATITSAITPPLPPATVTSPQKCIKATIQSTPTKSPYKTRHIKKCILCRDMKKKLGNAIKKQHEIRIKKNVELKSRRKKLCTRVLNQKVKRYQEKISKLSEINNTSSSNIPKQEMTKLKKNLKRVKVYHKHKLNKPTEDVVESLETKVIKLESELKVKNQNIVHLENENMKLKEADNCQPKLIDKEGKKYSNDTRMFAFDLIDNHVATENIPVLMEQFAKRAGIQVDKRPHRNTIENWVRELGTISELQAGEILMTTCNVTLGFDATTQEGTHINAIHITTESECYALGIDELPGGTASDYHTHICDTIDILALTYSTIYDQDYQECRKIMISHITNTMTDRCAANHAAIMLVNESWNKTLNEMSCHLHPLDSIASSARAALKSYEAEAGVQKDDRGIYGTDCFAANIVLQMNKLRYKDGKGDPRGFCNFLTKRGLPRGLLPRYRGNRLHILFHLCGIYYKHHQLFVQYLQTGGLQSNSKVPLNDTNVEKHLANIKLRTAVLKDIQRPMSVTELHVLGLLGKIVTAPWMKMFYVSYQSELSHVDAIARVVAVITLLKLYITDPLSLLSATSDIFGNTLPDTESDPILCGLRNSPPPENVQMWQDMMKACLSATVNVLERQYKKYFLIDVTAELRKETASTRLHNIDSEEVMGMFSAAKAKSPNATLCYLSCKIRARKNKTIAYIDRLDKGARDTIMNKTLSFSRKQRERRKKQQREMTEELIKRQKEKQQSREQFELRKLDRSMKKATIDDVIRLYPEISDEKRSTLTKLMDGTIIGTRMCHTWAEDDGSLIVYNGRFEKFKKTTRMYTVGYWRDYEQYEDAADYLMPMYELVNDLMQGDLIVE